MQQKNKNIYRQVFSLTIVLCCMLSASLFPQSFNELQERLKRADGPDMSIILNKLSEAVRKKRGDRTHYEKGLEYARKALRYAKTFEQEEQELYALANTGWIYLKLKEYEPALKYLKMSVALAEKRKVQKELIYALSPLSMVYSLLPDYPRTVKILKRLGPIYAETGDKNNEAGTYLSISNLLGIMGETGEVLQYRLKALQLYRETGNQARVVMLLEYIGYYYAKSGQNTKALEYFLQAIKTGEQHGVKRFTYRAYISYAEFLVNQKNFADAAGALDKAIKIAHRPESTISPILALYWKAVISKERKEYDRALEFLDRAIKFRGNKKPTPYDNPITLLMETGQVYFKKKEYQTAISYYTKALEFAVRVKNVSEQAECYKYLGEVRAVKGELEKAGANLKKSLELALNMNNSLLIRDNYQLLSDLSEKKGTYKTALEYHRLYAAQKDKIYTEKSAKSIAEMKTRYETEKKEREIELLRKNERLRELTVSRQRITIIAAITGLLLIVVIMAYFGKKYHYLLVFWKKKHFIGNYKVVDKIASGGMAIVYKAHDIRDKSKAFAIKVLREEFFDNETHKKRFKHEASIIDNFNHPNIIKISERGESGGNLYIVMELLDGKTLARLIEEQGKLPIDAVLNILLQVFDALVKIHAKNIIHRDLKPENIMLVQTPGNPYFVKLLDFGLAKTKAFSRLTRTGIVLGTTYYLSPEQIMDTGVSTASDVYAMGVIGCEMLTGQKPFDAGNEAAIVGKILENNPPRLSSLRPGIPAELEELLASMIHKNPEDRPTTEEISKILNNSKDFSSL